MFMKCSLVTRNAFIAISAIFFILGIASGLALNVYFEKKVVSVMNAPKPPVGRSGVRVEAAATNPFTLTVDQRLVTFDTAVVTGWLETYVRLFSMRQERRPNPQHIAPYVAALTRTTDKAPTNALLGTNTDIKEIKAGHNGSALNIMATVANIQIALGLGQSNAIAVIEPIYPEISREALAVKGITTHLARGESDFVGSPSFRTHNIKTGVRTFRGIFIQPGEEFSFNGRLGAIDASTGYLPELVIKGKKIIPEYGGGLCQVSTTFFRAAFLAGLPIIERHPHSIPVRYYSPQGFDAAIYPGSADLRFTNDIATPLFIQAQTVGTKIFVDVYGAPSARRITVQGPSVIEKKDDGSLHTVLIRTVTDDSVNPRRDTFYSFYHSPAEYEVIKNPLE